MANLAIKGHKTRGKEVIEILEMLGGKSYTGLAYKGEDPDRYYCIDKETNFINASLILKEFQVFSIEEFFEKFPYKVGDRVRVPEYESEVRISKMYWDGNEVQYEVVTDEVEWYSAKELNEFNEPNKEETVGKEKNDRVKWDLPDGYEFQDKEGNVINTDVIKLVKKQSYYPKNFKECCEALSLGENGKLYTKGYNASLIQDFHKLIICRDSYWKIAGEQMGLGKPWEPDWSNSTEIKYCITTIEHTVEYFESRTVNIILAFPTEEMRDAFDENFKDLIEQCKELL